MKSGDHEFFNKSCGIAQIKNDKEDVFCVFSDSFENHDQSHLGYIIAYGDTKEEALINSIKALIEEKKKLSLKIKNIFESREACSGERVIVNENKAVYDVDPQFLNK
jgi:hypothetical protein